VRRWKASTEDSFFAEVGAALQFPDYYGENWAATAECLGDLDLVAKLTPRWRWKNGEMNAST
jgi:Barstar (barnase inhibitor)